MAPPSTTPRERSPRSKVETYVIGSLDVQWKTENRGRGDRINIAFTDYTILSVDAENELTLTAPYGGTTTFTEPYTISRKFQKLKGWEECIEATVGCPGVTSANLVTDDRIEVGVVYKDSTYFMNTGVEELKFDDPTTDMDHTITLTTTPPNRHHGVLDTGVILDNGAQGSPAIEINTGWVTIEWIELQRGDGGQILVNNVGSDSKIIVRNVIFFDDDNSARGFHVNDGEANVLVFNNILYGLNHGVHVDGLDVGSNGLFEFYHNTFYKNVIGLNSTRGTSAENDVIVMNGNLAISNTSFDFDALLPNPSSANNWSSDGTGASHGGVGPIAPALVEFVSEIFPEDFHIKPGSVVIDQGAAIAAVVDDIDGRFRGSPDIGADETNSSSANPVKILTAKSASGQVQLEWQHPDFGPMNFVEVWRDLSAFPLRPVPSEGEWACSYATPIAGTKGQCADTLLLTDGTPYYYSAFVYDFGGNYSKETSVLGKPFATGAVPPEWTYATNAATLFPAGVRGSNAFVVSNDRFFHAMQGGSGEWPSSGWAPYRLPQEVQHRPVIVPIATNPTALLGAVDGRVYAVDIGTGRLVWKSKVLMAGASINAAPAALVMAYGATGGGADQVFVGTSDATSNSLFVLDLMTGDVVNSFDDVGQASNIGPVTGVAVQYPNGPVFFTSNDGTGPTNRNVWSIDVDVTAPTPPVEIWSDAPGQIDAGPTLYQSWLFVGSRAGSLIGYSDLGVAPVFTHPLGDGRLKAPFFPCSGTTRSWSRPMTKSTRFSSPPPAAALRLRARIGTKTSARPRHPYFTSRGRLGSTPGRELGVSLS